MVAKKKGMMESWRKIYVLIFFLPAFSALGLDVSSFEKLAIQDGGRVKPFDSFARESVQLITGTQKYQGKNPTEIVLSWLMMPDGWKSQPIFQIRFLELKKDLGIPESQALVSPAELLENPKTGPLFARLAKLEKEKRKPTPYDKSVQRLYNQTALFNEIISGAALRLLPQRLSDDWLAVNDFKDEAREKFRGIAKAYLGAIARGETQGFETAVSEFRNFAKNQAPGLYPSEGEIQMEILYNKSRPFFLAYIFYLLAAISLLFSLRFPKSAGWFRSGIFLTVVGFAIHIWGFVLRCMIAGRPPVSNMYESIIWVSSGCVFFGLVFEAIYKKRYFLLSACSMATIGLIIGDSFPAVLDQNIRTLEPVLRSNYWLTIHVLTITLSYAAFALAAGIGNIGLSYYARGRERENEAKLSSLSLFAYRAIQVGVLLLTAGTILGGVWADRSWGRFWGWDPKETWALIADLGYLAVLHGRFAGWFRVFGTLAAAVCCFVGVIMSWYGVNFVLGVGLHSYGFSTGGVQYVGAAVLIQLAYVTWAGIKHTQAIGQSGNRTIRQSD